MAQGRCGLPNLCTLTRCRLILALFHQAEDQQLIGFSDSFYHILGVNIPCNGLFMLWTRYL